MKAILFDFWGTLVETGVWSPVRQVKDILRIKEPFSTYIVRFEKALMTKKFDSLQDAFIYVCDEFCTNYDKLPDLVGLWNKNWMLARPYDDIDVLKELRKKYKIFLVSNTDYISVKNVISKFEMDSLFDEQFLSCDTGFLKTDKGLYELIQKKTGIEIKDMLMIGDSIETDYNGPKMAGADAILIDRRGRRDFSPKIKELKELKNL